MGHHVSHREYGTVLQSSLKDPKAVQGVPNTSSLAVHALPSPAPSPAPESKDPTQIKLWGSSPVFFWLVKEEKVTRTSYSGRRIHHEPPCVKQGAGDCPGGSSPPTNPLAKFARQELPYPQGRWLVAGSSPGPLPSGL